MRTVCVALTLAPIVFYGTLAEAADKLALSNDFSREELANFAADLEGDRAYSYYFVFPDHVTDRLFGIDVSHHNGQISWDKVVDQKVSFAFVKASQGENGYDPLFQKNWDGIGKSGGIYRGAYHFFTADGDPELQAKNFLEVVGKLGVTDLPPVLDLEWDFQREKNQNLLKATDRWASVPGPEIARRALTWLKIVEAATGKRPIVYTNAGWIAQRVGADSGELTNYVLWIADYSGKSLKAEKPKAPAGYKWILWQLTDSGKVAGLGHNVDTSRFSGSIADLKQLVSEAH